MPTVVDTAAAFIIRELSGELRTLRLLDRGLPYRPIDLAGEQRVELTWYPGNPEATATVLGPQENNTTINGYWKDKYISRAVVPGETEAQGGTQTVQVFPITVDDQPVDDVRAAALVVDNIRRQGQLLEVSWDTQIRRGYLKKFRQRWHNIHDMEWEIDFVWISQGEPTPAAVLQDETSISDTSSIMEQQNTKLQNDATFEFPVTLQTQTEIIARLVAINDTVRSATAITQELSRQTVAPFDASRRLIAVCTSIETATLSLVSYLEASPYTLLDAAAPPADLTFPQRLLGAVYARTLISDARVLRRTAISRRSSLLEQINTELLGIYTAREGDDLRAVSQKFYGTPFEWRRVMIFNELNVSRLSVNQLVLIPRISSGDPRQ